MQIMLKEPYQEIEYACGGHLFLCSGILPQFAYLFDGMKHRVEFFIRHVVTVPCLRFGSERYRRVRDIGQLYDHLMELVRINSVRQKSWMNNTPAYLQLQWFDAVEEVKISSELRSKRWNTEVTERDRLYLTKLGMNLT